MTTLRVLIVDDEPLARAGIRQLLQADPELTVGAECGDGASAVTAIRQGRFDLVVLDIQMPEMSGIDVIRAIGPDRMPAVVFVTAFDRFAVEAFEIDVVDYVLKPFRDDRFHEAVARVKRQVAGKASNTPAYLERLVIKTGGYAHLVRTEEIDWIEAADYCAKIHVAGQRHVIRESMARLERHLDPRRFFRIHRSAIVNLDRVKAIRPFALGDQAVVLRDGSTLKLSRSRRGDLESRLGSAK